MTHEPWLERADLHALGALEGEEQAQFESHVAAGCPLCDERLHEAREALALLPRALPPVPPPGGVKLRLMEEVGGSAAARARGWEAAGRPGVPWRVWGGWVGAVLAAALILAAALNLHWMRQDLLGVRREIALLKTQVTQQEEMVGFLADPTTRLVILTGLPPSPAASARLIWEPTSRTGLLLARNLPSTPPDKIYELWAIAGKEPVPAGSFLVGPAGKGHLRLPVLPEDKQFTRFAVTLEPVPGVAKPTGPMHLSGGL